MTDDKLRAAHEVYPDGPPCNPNCPGPHSMYHDGYADGYENGERAALAASATDEGRTVRMGTVERRPRVWIEDPDASATDEGPTDAD